MKVSFFNKHFAIMLLLGLAVFTAPLTAQEVVNTRTWQTYTSIQTAIDASSDGDTLVVSPGTYQENILVDKAVAIIGDPGRTPVIDGGTSGDVITITADRAMVKFLTIKSRATVSYACVKIAADKVSVIGNNIRDCFDGIHAVADADDTQIKDNDLENCNRGAVKIESNNNIVHHNNVHDIYIGLWVSIGTGNVLSNNTVSGYEFVGIFMYIGDDNWIYSNIITGDDNPLTGGSGIQLISGTNNAIMANTVQDSDYGLYLFDSSSNKIHHNNFVNNTCHAVINTVYPISINTWHNGYGGNYWSGHTGTDANNDGIIDSTPYPVPDQYCNGQYDQDPYPLVNIWGPIPGNVNGSPDGLIEISDISLLIDYLSMGGTDDPVPPCVGDVNGDGKVYDDDIDYLVDSVFGSGPDPVANCCFFLVLPKFFN